MSIHFALAPWYFIATVYGLRRLQLNLRDFSPSIDLLNMVVYDSR